MTEEPEEKRCPSCKGLGYHRCDCWPGDCICGEGDETCEYCDGEGWVDLYCDDDLENLDLRPCARCEEAPAAEGSDLCERCAVPKPGSPEAVSAGCTCPVIDNHHGAGVAGNGARYGWWKSSDCPLHVNQWTGPGGEK